jgi:hypothetical protein
LRKFASLLPEHADECGQEILSYSSKERMRQALREKQNE